MSEKHSASEDIPLPDPDQLQRAATAALHKIRTHRLLYGGLALLVLVAVVVLLMRRSLEGSANESAFSPLWQRCEAVRDKLAIDLSAAPELETLETYLEEIRGTPEEGFGLWFLAVYHYREAYTTDKTSFADREPHLRKALAYLDELDDERFDEMLLAKPRWYTSSATTPIDQLRNQVRKDLEFEKANAYEEPAPEPDPVAVLRTSAGDIFLHFYGKLAPKHTETFIRLATLGTYNGTAFHFIGGGPEAPKSVMGGDPYSFFFNDPKKKEHLLRWGKGGTGSGLPPEESRFRILHRARIVTSQRTAKSDWDNGCQFQIMTDTDTALDRIHTPFARVVEGMEVVEKAARAKTASQHAIFKDDFAFGTQATRYLVVEPVVLHKVIIYRNRKAIEHSFPLTDAERSLDTVKGSPVEPLPEDKIYSGRRLRRIDADGDVRPGLDIPFPDDIADEDANPLGDRKAG